MLKQHFPIKTKRLQQLVAILVIVLVAGIGTYLLTGSHAATPYSSVTADSGTLSSGATKQACSGSNDGSCVVFGSSTSSGGGGVTGTDSNKGVPWVGLNDFTGWGPPLSHQYLSDGFRWARISVDGNYAAGNAIDSTLSNGCGDGNSSDPGCNALVILPDNASEAMTWMNHYNTAAYASRLVYEFGNEQYLTNSGYTMTAPAYAQAYETAYNAKHAANIPQPLLFMTTGNPCWGSLTADACSTDGELYLEKAMNASQGGVPNLKVDAFSTHTYGGANGNWNNDTNGVGALLAQHQDAVAHGFTNTPWYVTEWGVSIDPSQSDGQPASGDCFYATSYSAQATCITAGYNQMISYGDGVNGTWLQGVVYYQTHDDSTGWWGLLTSPTSASVDAAGEPAGNDTSTDNTPITLRPSYDALKAFLTNH